LLLSVLIIFQITSLFIKSDSINKKLPNQFTRDYAESFINNFVTPYNNEEYAYIMEMFSKIVIAQIGEEKIIESLIAMQNIIGKIKNTAFITFQVDDSKNVTVLYRVRGEKSAGEMKFIFYKTFDNKYELYSFNYNIQ
jgi:hypothetical protein